MINSRKLYPKKIIEIITLIFGLNGTLLITFATRISPHVRHGLESGGMAHVVIIVHPNWVHWGVRLILLAFILSIINIFVSKK